MTMAKKNDKNEIINRISEGDFHDIDHLYKIYRKEFIFWGQKIFKNADTDLLIDAWQNAIIAFYQQIVAKKLVHLNCEVKTYLFILAKRYFLKSIDKMEKFNHIEIAKLEAVEMEDFIEFEYDDPWISEKQHINTAINSMGTQCRELLKFKFVDDLSIDDIMIKSGYNNVNTVSASISRCLRKLKELVNQSMTNARE